MLLASWYSIAGLVIGITIGKYLCATDRNFPMFWKREEPAVLPTDNEGIPVAIPKVEFDAKGEPVIAREKVVRQSPVPRWLTVMIIILTLASVGYLWVTRDQAKHDAQIKQSQLEDQIAANAALIAAVKHDEQVNEDRQQRLSDLILAISTATTPGEVNAAIQKYLKQSAAANKQEQRYQQEHGGAEQSSSSGNTQGDPSPQPSPQHSPQPSHSPEPHNSPSAHPSPSSSPTKPPVVETCVATPKGRVCLKIPPIPTLFIIVW